MTKPEGKGEVGKWSFVSTQEVRKHGNASSAHMALPIVPSWYWTMLIQHSLIWEISKALKRLIIWSAFQKDRFYGSSRVLGKLTLNARTEASNYYNDMQQNQPFAMWQLWWERNPSSDMLSLMIVGVRGLADDCKLCDPLEDEDKNVNIHLHYTWFCSCVFS